MSTATNIAPSDLAPAVDFSTLGFQKPVYDLRFADTQVILKKEYKAKLLTI